MRQAHRRARVQAHGRISVKRRACGDCTVIHDADAPLSANIAHRPLRWGHSAGPTSAVLIWTTAGKCSNSGPGTTFPRNGTHERAKPLTTDMTDSNRPTRRCPNGTVAPTQAPSRFPQRATMASTRLVSSTSPSRVCLSTAMSSAPSWTTFRCTIGRKGPSTTPEHRQAASTKRQRRNE